MKKIMQLVAALLALVMIAACATTAPSVREIKGKIDVVDVSKRTITLTGVENAPGDPSTLTIAYGDDTRVRYGGQSFKPENLERGDEVAVLTDAVGDRLTARTITVVKNVRATEGLAAGSSATDRFANASRGSIRSIDTAARMLEIDLGGLTAHIIRVHYDENTTVEENGQKRAIADLKVGETIDVNTARSGDRLNATAISLLRAPVVAAERGTSGTAIADVSGTVVSLSRSAIQLERASWGRTFKGEMPETVTIRFDERTQLEYQGRRVSPTGLERGDVIDVQLRGASTPYIAERIWLISNVRDRR